jgi:hypothetical protein
LVYTDLITPCYLGGGLDGFVNLPTVQSAYRTKDDPRLRSCISWESIVIPTDIDRGAPAVVRIERIIAAASERLWQLQIGVADWPSWQKDIEAATLEGPFATGNSFTWTTAGLAQPIVSTIYSVQAKRSMLWGGPSAGIAGIHRWTFEAVDPGTRVTTEESWAGAPVKANPTDARKMLETSLDRWLDFLAAAAGS